MYVVVVIQHVTVNVKAGAIFLCFKLSFQHPNNNATLLSWLTLSPHSIQVFVCVEVCCSYLDTTSGKINIFNILISSSPGNWKYFTSCEWQRKNPIKTCLKHQVMHYVKKCGTQVLALCGDLQYSCSCKCHLWCSLLIAEECFLCTNKSSTILLDQLEKNEFEQFAIPISMIGFL